MLKVPKERLIAWRRQDAITKIEHPSNIKKARALGFRAKQGYVVVRTTIRKGARIRPKPAKGRNPSRIGRKYTPKQSLQTIAEKRVARKFPNLEVLNSYYIAEDGVQTFYEVILVDPHHPAIRADPKINWICKQRRRAFRGLTSSGKKSRAL